MTETQAPGADDLPDPCPEDARRAVVDAARKDGLTCIRGAYEARRTWVESDHVFGTYRAQNVVVLSLRVGYGGDTVGIFPVYPAHDVRDDWERPAPDDHERGDDVLPPEDFGLDDIFLDPAALPGPEPENGGDGDVDA